MNVKKIDFSQSFHYYTFKGGHSDDSLSRMKQLI